MGISEGNNFLVIGEGILQEILLEFLAGNGLGNFAGIFVVNWCKQFLQPLVKVILCALVWTILCALV